MKGIILHGGTGTRLRPLTYTDVKQLLPLAGKPVSEYALINLKELDIKDINIVLGEVGASEVREYYKDGKKWNLNISYTFQGKPLGIAHAIGLTADFVGDDDFVVVLGDNYFHKGFLSLKETFLKNDKDVLLAVIEVKNPEQFGIAEILNGNIIRLVEKPKHSNSSMAITGVYFLRKNIFPFIKSLSPSNRGELELTEAFQKMIESGMKIGYVEIKGWWKDTGTPEEFLSCNMMALENIPIRGDHSRSKYWRALIESDASVDENSKIMGPCFIGSGADVKNSYIGPYTSIGRRCKVNNCHIENSIVMDDVSIDLDSRIMIKDSLIGSSSKIGSNGENSRSFKFIVGRDSKVEI